MQAVIRPVVVDDEVGEVSEVAKGKNGGGGDEETVKVVAAVVAVLLLAAVQGEVVMLVHVRADGAFFGEEGPFGSAVRQVQVEVRVN